MTAKKYDFTCANCKRQFKNAAGLSAHMRFSKTCGKPRKANKTKPSVLVSSAPEKIIAVCNYTDNLCAKLVASYLFQVRHRAEHSFRDGARRRDSRRSKPMDTDCIGVYDDAEEIQDQCSARLFA